MKKNGLIIIDSNYEKIKKYLADMYSELDSTGNVFVISRNEYNGNNDIICDHFDISNSGVDLGYHYVNTIVAPTEKKACEPFRIT